MKLFLCVLLSLGATACPFSCGPQDVPANAASCPASRQPDGSPCADKTDTCNYTGPARACGAGTSAVYTIVCSDRGRDAGDGVWTLMGCM